MSSHAHVAALDGALVVTAGARTLRIRLGTPEVAAVISDPVSRAEVRAALEDRLGPLAAWPEGERPGCTRLPDGEADVVLWWSAGAWYACRREDEHIARPVVRTHAPDGAIAAAWDTPGIGHRLGLEEHHDPDRAAALQAAMGLRRGEIVRSTAGRSSTHRLAPWPDEDPVTGVVRAMNVHPAEPGLPSAFRHVQAMLPHTDLGWPGWQPDRLAQAATFVTDGATGSAEVREAAVRAAVAHLAGPWTGASCVRSATIAELDAGGELFVPPARLHVTDLAVAEHPASPITSIDPRLSLAWVRGRRLADDRESWVPLRFVHTSVLPAPVPDQPPSGFHNLVGMAAARTRSAAVRAALGHVVSHDAVARWWRRRDACAPARAAIPESLRRAWGDADVELDLRRLPGPGGLTVVLAVVRDHSRGIVGLGHGAGPFDEAAHTAALDALVQLVSARDLDNADSRIRLAQQRGLGDVAGLLAYRQGRDYLSAVPAAAGIADGRVRRGMLDPLVHVQVGLDPRVVEHLERRLRGAGGSRPEGDGDTDADEPLDLSEVVAVETTPPQIGSDWFAVRVVLPGALRLEPAALPLPAPRWGVAETIPYPGW